MLITKKIFFYGLIILSGLFLFSNKVLAQSCATQGGACTSTCPQQGYTARAGLCSGGMPCCIPNCVAQMGGQCVTNSFCSNNVIQGTTGCATAEVCCGRISTTCSTYGAQCTDSQRNLGTCITNSSNGLTCITTIDAGCSVVGVRSGTACTVSGSSGTCMIRTGSTSGENYLDCIATAIINSGVSNPYCAAISGTCRLGGCANGEVADNFNGSCTVDPTADCCVIDPSVGTPPPGTPPPGTQPPGTQPPGTQPPGTQPPGGANSVGSIPGIYVPSGAQLGMPDPQNGVLQILVNILTWFITIFGIITMLGLIVSGVQYIAASGNEGTMETAKRNMTYCIIGLIVGLSGYIIIKAVYAALTATALF